MAEEGEKGGGFSMPSAGLLALTVAVFGLILAGPAPFIDERPASQQDADADKGKVLDVDARMWQDPLGAVLKAMPRGEGGERGSARRDGHTADLTVNRAFSHTTSDVGNVLVLGVLIPGGPYPEEEERRRRQRYAVLSALATQGYAPEETEHIGYFLAHAGPAQDCATGCPAPDAFPVPFELFSGNAPRTAGGGAIVLWLDDSRFEHGVQRTLKDVLGQVAPRGVKAPITRAVIGPNTSGMLKTLAQEGAPADPALTFYAAGATLDDKDLGKPLPANVIRTIPADGAIARLLVAELGMRHVQPGQDHILLISEWDSLYGRTLPETFARSVFDAARAAGGKGAAADGPLCLPLKAAGRASAAHVYCVNYMRGVDGLLPRIREEDTAAQEAKAPGVLQVNTNIDQPSGNNQKDYLRRLVDQIRRVDSQIADAEPHSPFKNSGIAAIGVLGSDVYDKLMILQALRPYFPGKIFFTTDLDAEFFTPREQPYAHNLVIGSGYGLRLAPELQQSIPPFRDSYQTATFLAVKLAAARWDNRGTTAAQDDAGTPGGMMGSGRIFEIGRQGAVSLPLPGESAAPRAPCRDAQDILTCRSVQPAHDEDDGMRAAPYGFALRAATLALGLLLLHGMSWRSRSLFGRMEDWLRARFGTAVLAETAAMLPFAAAGLLITGVLYLAIAAVSKDEPFYWMNGVSTWPSNLLQLSALLLAFWFMRSINAILGKATGDIERRFRLDGAPEAGAAAAPRPLRPLALHKWVLPGEAAEARGGTIDVVALWREYRVYERHGSGRAAIGTALFALFGLAAIMLTGGLPAPARGLALYVDAAVETAAALSVVYLIMRVVDSARLAARFIEHIAANRETRWPCTGDPAWGWPGAGKDARADWIDVQFVAKYTRAIEKFIWFPIPSMLLLGVARSAIFDDWTFSAGLFVAIAALLGHLFSTAYLLQRGARHMREKSVERLEKTLRKLRGEPGAAPEGAAQVEKMIAEVRENREGAFMPFMRQPMVQALLTLLSSSGGLAVLLQHSFF